MILEGWSNPLQPYVVEAIERGDIAVRWDKKKKFQYLVGKVLSPHGHLIVFADEKHEESGATQTIFQLKQIADLKSVG